MKITTPIANIVLDDDGASLPRRIFNAFVIAWGFALALFMLVALVVGIAVIGGEILGLR